MSDLRAVYNTEVQTCYTTSPHICCDLLRITTESVQGLVVLKVLWREMKEQRRGVERGKARPLFRHIPGSRHRAHRVSHSVGPGPGERNQRSGQQSTLFPPHRKKVIQSSVTMLDQFLLLTVFGESESLQNSFWISLCSKTVNILLGFISV